MSEDINQEILKELRKSRRSNQAILVVASLVIIITAISSRLKPSSQWHSWTEVDSAMRQSDFPKALSLAQGNVALQPDYYYGHAYLGAIYLAMDDVTNSEAQYLRAYELFPGEDNAKNLAAVRKRLAAGKDAKMSK
jgi:tetratricopeptide (TPR) repeat protein